MRKVAVAILLVVPVLMVEGINFALADSVRKDVREECMSLSQRVLLQPKSDESKNIPILIGCLRFEYGPERAEVVKALSSIGKPAISALIKAANSGVVVIPRAAIETLGEMGPEARDAVPELMTILRNRRRYDVRFEIASALGNIGEIELLMGIAKGLDPKIQPECGVQGLKVAGPKASQSVPLLIELLRNNDSRLRGEAAEALGEIGPAANSAVPEMVELVKNESSMFDRHDAIEALQKIGTLDAKNAAEQFQARKRVEEFFLFIFAAVYWWFPHSVIAIVGLILLVILFFNWRSRRIQH